MPKKRMLSQQEEFEMMKLVLDKFLWIGTIILLYAGYVMLTGTTAAITESILLIVGAAVIFIVFIVMLGMYYEWAKLS